MTRSALRLAWVALAAAILCPRAISAPYEVVLAGGARIPAASRPIVAMGKVSFLDESRRPVSMPSSQVDVAATRAALGRSATAGKVWDEKALAKLDKGRIQFYGDEEGVVLQEAASVSGAEPDRAVEGTAAERLRAQIEGLNAKIRDLPTSDRSRSMMVIQQLELQQELSRVLSPPPQRG